MINLIGARLLPLPQGAKPAIASSLPWQNGSILSARMTPGDSPGNVMLMLGGYRLQAKIPANIPAGHVWLQLVNREMPAQFSLLSDSKAATVLSEMLANRLKSQEQVGRESAGAGRSSQETGWQKMEQSQLPFQAEVGVDARRLMLRDQQDGSPHGMVRASSNDYRFLLHGRADLDHLGPVAFALEGSEDGPWTLKLYAGRDSNMAELRPAFLKWLEEQRDCEETSRRSYIEGKLLGGLPEKFASLGSLHV